MIGLYIHVPFCAAICNYCNFNRGLFDGALKARYVDAIVAEIERSGAERPARLRHQPSSDGREHDDRLFSEHVREPADTVYFGGGTPSLLEPEEIGRIIETCGHVFHLPSNAEVTLEANPETVNEARLAAYRDAGVNRLSYGVQSFRDDELHRLSRLHGAERARNAYEEARRAGFDNVSLDLMMWLPAQRVADWLESVDAATVLGPDHLSLYLLEVYPNAPLKDEMARARWSQAPDEDAEAMYLEGLARLDSAGYQQYEISNVAREGRESRHNLKYWSDGNWLGFGCGAHSTRDGVRWKNVSATEDYVARINEGQSPVSERRVLGPTERLGDALFTGLRLTEGVNLDKIGRKYAVDVWDRFGPDLEPFLADGCLRRDGARLWLTRRGMLLANEIMAVFV